MVMNIDTPFLLAVLDLIVQVLTGIAAIVAFLFGVQQYVKGQKWQRAQILLSLIDSFESDERVEAACAMLDWDEREISIGEESIYFKNEMLISALRVPAMDTQVTFSKEERVIRDAFDAFFDFFHKLYAFQKSGLLTFAEYAYFYYWFELLRDVGRYKRIPNVQEVVHKYIDAYHFVGVRELLEEYSKKPEPLSIMEQEDEIRPE